MEKGILSRDGKIYTSRAVAEAHLAEALFSFHKSDGKDGLKIGRTLIAEDAREVYGGTLGM